MEEKKKWYGLREDEWIALAVVLFVGLLLSSFFTRGGNSAEMLLESDATPFAIVAESTDSVPTISLDGNIQAAGELVFVGTSAPNADVTVMIDGDVIGETSANSRGDWSLSHTVSEPGRYAAYARATNEGGRTVDSNIANFQVDDMLMSSGDDESVDSTAASAVNNAENAEETDHSAITDGAAVVIPDSGLENNISPENVGVEGAPTLRLPGAELLFGAVSVAGTAAAGSDVALFLDGKTLGNTQADGNGNWAYIADAGDINYGDHQIQAVADELASESITFSMRPPEAPVFEYNLDGVIGKPAPYRVSGMGTPNWKIQYSVNGVPFERPTNPDGEWEDDNVQLTKTGCYQFRLAALDANGDVVPETESGPYNVIITEDGNPVEGVCPGTEGTSENDSSGDLGAVGTDGDAGDETNVGDAEAAAQADDANATQNGEAGIVEDGNAGAAAADGSTQNDEAGATEDSAANAAQNGEAAEATGEEAVTEDAEAGAEGSDAGVDGNSAETETTNADVITLGQALEANGNFTTLLAAIETAGLGEVLQTDTPLTLFAPTDAAFAALPVGAVDAYLANPDALGGLVANHLLTGVLTSEDIDVFSTASPPSIENAIGSLLDISSSEAGLNVDGALISQPDIVTTNAMVHGIDSVLLPKLVPAPVIDTQGVPTFEGSTLTIVGTAAPNTVLAVVVNGQFFGRTNVGEDGTWLVADEIIDGQYEIIAYTYTNSGLLLAASDVVNLTAPNK
ncbi:MAG: fasciclin domain-containing protein [Candidatus Promineifilaceae bacterium]